MPDSQTPITIFGCIAAVAYAVDSYFKGRKIKGIHNQVHNSHPPDSNLRDDVDKVTELVRDVRKRAISRDEDIGFIRRDISHLCDEIDGVRSDFRKETDRIKRDARLLEIKVNDCRSPRGS